MDIRRASFSLAFRYSCQHSHFPALHRGFRREFLGFNRARHAVLEAAILATRVHMLPAEQIREEFARLQVIVDKTAGPREFEAMALLTEHIRRAPVLPARE